MTSPGKGTATVTDANGATFRFRRRRSASPAGTCRRSPSRSRAEDGSRRMRFLCRSQVAVIAAAFLLCAGLNLALLTAPQPAGAQVVARSSASSSSGPSGGSDSLEQAAKRAGDTGRKVAMYLIGLAFAFAAVLLVFKRDFREA